MTKSKPALSTGWVFEDGYWECLHFTDYTNFNDDYDTKYPYDEDSMMRRHVLLEFLSYLSVLEYTRGYDGYYYDITIRYRRN